METKLFKMSEGDLGQLLEDCQSSAILGLLSWIELGKKMGFDPFTAKIVPDKGLNFFYAEPIKDANQK